MTPQRRDELTSRWRIRHDQVRRILEVAAQRANLLEQLRKLPSSDKLAEELGIHRSTIFRVLAGANKSPAPQCDSES